MHGAMTAQVQIHSADALPHLDSLA